MNPIGISVVRADEASVYANYYYDEGPTVYIEILGINSPNSEWRISGRHSLGDTEIYLHEQGLGTFSFDSSDKKSYVLQIQNWNNDWVNTTNMYGEPQENSIINVNFESSSGDSGDGSWEEAGKNKLYINEGNGTKITVIRTWTDYSGGVGVLQDGADIWYPADRFQITAEALPGYKIDYYTSDDGEYLPFIMDNLTKPYDGEPYQLSGNSDATVSATATRSTNIRIDDGTSFDNKYWCYIDTEHVEYPENDLNCTVVGQRSGYYVPDIDEMNWYATYNESYTMDNESSWGACYLTSSRDEYMVYFLKFYTPEFYSVSEELKIEIKMRNNSAYSESNQTVHYALCTSDENYHLYLDTVDSVSDPHQIATGTFQEVNGDDKISTILIKTDKLISNTTYYLLVWDAYKSSEPSAQVKVKPASNHTITLKRDDSNSPFYYTKFDLYIPYIDNGASWEPL